MAWFQLLAAGILEIVWAGAMKQSQGFTRLWPTVVMLAAMLGSFGLLALAMRALPLGTAYPIWTGIGAVGAFALGIVAMGEAATPGRLLAAALIVWFFLYESRGLSLEHVDMLYSQGKSLKPWKSASWTPPGYITRDQRDEAAFQGDANVKDAHSETSHGHTEKVGGETPTEVRQEVV